jgi:hypothetical protein
MTTETQSKNGALKWLSGVVALLALLLVACGTSAPAVPEAQAEPTTAPTVAQPAELGIQETPTAAPAVATPAPHPPLSRLRRSAPGTPSGS